MAAKRRFSDWMSSEPEPGVRPPRFTEGAVGGPKGIEDYQYLLQTLRSRSPGMWTSNLLELSRHFTSGAFLAINTMANQASAAEHKVYERTLDPNDGDTELPWTEPICRLLEDPNDDDSFPDIMYQTTQQLGLTGICLEWTPPTGPAGVPGEIYIIPSATALPMPPTPAFPHGSYQIQPYYPYGGFSAVPSYQSAGGARIPAEQIIRIKNHHPLLRYDGYAVLTAIARQVDTVEAIDLARWNTQQNGVDATVAFDFDPALFNPDTFDLKRVREQLIALYAGPGKAGQILINPFGSKVSKISNTPLEMAWQEGWAQLLEFALACYGVPKSVAGLQDSVSFAGLHTSMKQFYIISLMPLLQRICGKQNKHLLPKFGDDIYLQLTGQKIQDDDLLERQLANDDRVGLRTVNERRKLRDLPPVPWGDERVGVPSGKPAEEAISPDGRHVEEQQGVQHTQDADQLAVERARPRTGSNQDSLGPRGKSMSNDRLAGILDAAKVRGTIGDVPVNGRKLVTTGR